jgi:hypothetical protein
VRRHRTILASLMLVLAAAWPSAPALSLNITVNGALGDLDGNGDMGAGEAAVVQAVANCWAARVPANRNFTLNVAGGALTGGTIGQGAVSSVNGSNIPTAGAITMDNDGSTVYFVDATPLVNSEFTPDTQSQWRFVGGANTDLFSVVIHEVGHALAWLCGAAAGCGFTNPLYDGLMNPTPANFVTNGTCAAPFPLAGQAALAGCVHLQAGGTHPLDVSLRGDGVGTQGQKVNELSHPGVSGDLMIGFYTTGARETQSVVDVDVFNHAYADAVNLPLTVNAGADIISECNTIDGSNVTLNGNGSTDPENNALTFSWACPGVALANAMTATPTGFFLLNTTVPCRLDATDVAACPPDADIVNVTVVDTMKPSVVCPVNTTVECTATGGTPAGDPQLVAFFAGFSATDLCDATLVKTNNAPAFFASGSTPVTFGARDDSNNFQSCTSSVTVADMTPPVITCPSNVSVECTGNRGTLASNPIVAAFLAGAAATDVCDSTPTITNDAPGFFGLGTTPVTFTARDDAGNPKSCTATVTVVDTTPPSINVTLDPTQLWPPNHKLVDIKATVPVTDICDPSAGFVLSSITSNEPEDGRGDGHTQDDIQAAELGTSDTQIKLRSERSGPGGGRVYTIVYTASDNSGNTTQAAAQVHVAHDQR